MRIDRLAEISRHLAPLPEQVRTDVELAAWNEPTAKAQRFLQQDASLSVNEAKEAFKILFADCADLLAYVRVLRLETGKDKPRACKKCLNGPALCECNPGPPTKARNA